MSLSEVTRIGKVQTHSQCPKCGSSSINRESIKHETLQLWDLREWCTMCKWSKETENVRMT